MGGPIFVAKHNCGKVLTIVILARAAAFGLGNGREFLLNLIHFMNIYSI
jgi:hypothetical protein